MGGELERPIHHAELIYDVTLKWSTWAEMDRRNTYLLLKRNLFFEEAVPSAVPPISIFGEAYYGSPSSRSVYRVTHFRAKLGCILGVPLASGQLLWLPSTAQSSQI